MGFSLGYTNEFVPKILLRTLSLLASIQNLVLQLFRFLGLSYFFGPDPLWQVRMTEYPPVSASLIREFLPVIKFRELVHPPDTCAVCLHEFEGGHEIRWLSNCTHIFHRTCLDRWMDQEQTTCPLCRASFLPDEMAGRFNQQ